MEREIADHMIEVIQADATERCQLFFADGAACAIGGLYADIVGRNVVDLYAELGSGQHAEYVLVMEHYNLTQEMLDEIYKTNDRYLDIPGRHAALTELINSWVE